MYVNKIQKSLVVLKTVKQNTVFLQKQNTTVKNIFY